MKQFLVPALLLAGSAATAASAEDATPAGEMVVGHAVSSAKLAAAPHFTGAVHVEAVGTPVAPARVNSGVVTFAPEARSYWHTHPAGQTLIVTAGEGWVQTWGGTPRKVHAGDVIWTPPGVKHWHGATAGGTMTHVAVQETVDGRNVDWAEPVSDAQYGQAK